MGDVSVVQGRASEADRGGDIRLHLRSISSDLRQGEEEVVDWKETAR